MAKDIIKVTDDIGITDNDLMMIVMVVMMAAIMQQFMTPMTQAAQKYYASQQYLGLVDSRDLHCSEILQWVNFVDSEPYNPWIGASFYNEGPDDAHLSFNTPDRFSILESGETWNISWIGAQERLSVIFYRTDPGRSALVRAKGKY